MPSQLKFNSRTSILQTGYLVPHLLDLLNDVGSSWFFSISALRASSLHHCSWNRGPRFVPRLVVLGHLFDGELILEVFVKKIGFVGLCPEVGYGRLHIRSIRSSFAATNYSVVVLLGTQVRCSIC